MNEQGRSGRSIAVIVATVVVVLAGVVVCVEGLGLHVSGVAKAAEEQEGGAPQGPPPALVKVGVVEKKALQNRWPVTGRLREIRRSTVAAEQEGKIVEVRVEDGDAVVGGQTILAKVDPVWAELSLDAAKARVEEGEAAVSQAETLLDQADRDAKQIQALFDRRTTTQKELDDVKSVVRARQAQLASAGASLASASAELRRAEESVKRLTILAPFDGTVVSKMVEVGRWVTQGAAVAEIVSSGSIDAVIDVPEGIVNNLKRGAALPVRVDALGVSVAGVVKAVVPSGQNAARTFPVRVRLDDKQGQFKPGMSVTAMVPMNEKREFLTVPRDAVLGGDLGDVVWIDAGGIGLPVGVRVLFGVQDRLAVNVNAGGGGPGLMPGMSVVIEGAERLFPTRPLMIANPPAAGGGNGSSGESGPDADKPSQGKGGGG